MGAMISKIGSKPILYGALVIGTVVTGALFIREST